ncbi:L,D-transpeptidase [Luteolibacter ambystomatis]|uniref:L,D-transpeptidase n=1 Tax=Luteolibacter ambystomatis TaxID=2824561 RepID=A0A975IXW2_9BACT|nr:L,D-transpeptidase [Luteolibacter ambystomatis]QUE49756.1 L,D-transpeptidase [Luteolibacter ambystomatis]
MYGKLLRNTLLPFSSLLLALGLASCGSTSKDTRNKVLVSVRDQKMMLMQDNKPVKTYKVSTSKFGIGDKPGSNCTPLGHLEVASKIGDSFPSGTVIKNRRPTGEILKPNAPGRDPIVSRIMWLKGTDKANKNTFGRCIYIHGTAEEWRLGTPASYGCIRMASKDVIDLYKRLGVGADVHVMRDSLDSVQPVKSYASVASNH